MNIINVNLFFIAFFIFFLLELFFYILTKYTKKKFQWIIDISDEKPLIQKSKIDKFIKDSYDKDLGWIRKPNSNGSEYSTNNKSTFSIDKFGSRLNPYNINDNYHILSYGDSFTFCRQVNDWQTWQAYLSKKTNLNISNFGVGNYGIDQAHILYKRHKHFKNKIVIFGVVPETILRVHSFWKHYLEYGNLLGFKPMYNINKENNLTLIRNAVVTNKDYYNYYKYIIDLRKYDFFYLSKFKKNLIKFPFTFHYFYNLKRNFSLLINVIVMDILNKLKIKNNIYNEIFQKYVIDTNTKLASDFYNQSDKTALLFKIIEQINFDVQNKKSRFIFLLLPQLSDIKHSKTNNTIYYGEFVKSLVPKINVIDLSSKFLQINNPESYFVEDKYGGHLNEKGNVLVSKAIKDYLSNKNFI